jgi:hypothetical protein
MRLGCAARHTVTLGRYGSRVSGILIERSDTMRRRGFIWLAVGLDCLLLSIILVIPA